MNDSSNTSSICGCGATVRDGYLCRTCARQLRDDLVELAPGKQMLPSYALGSAGRGTTTRWDTPSAVMVGGLAEDLTTTAARQARISNADGGAEKPVPFNPRAAELRAVLTNMLRPWALWLHGRGRPVAELTRPVCSHRDPVGADCPSCAAETAAIDQRMQQWRRLQRELERADVGALAGYLAQHVDVVRGDEAAPQLKLAIENAVARVREVIDRQPDQIAVGQCGAELPEEHTCQEPLYVDREASFVTCPACDTTWSVADRRAWLLAGAHDELGTAATIAASLTRLDDDHRLSVNRIYQWRHRGKLIDYGRACAAHRVPEWVETGRHASCQDCGQALYRVGDVVALLTASMVAETARRAKAERLQRERSKKARVARQRELLKRSKAGSAGPVALGPGLPAAIENTVNRRRSEAG
ncbi:hypothetical protein [Blastococcus sp. CT_GayMR16]|uniref:hypothetical protein n=1 Tax=Blastococcus sp. CT_GayMR16 TaxID=2559607 RepID=UPI001073C522|nr:hypothetical protein [Blastococcus sp. CT_GayMR16]TFV83141.1 hypothetical protein E4P38_21025 [Blastococcus sp. CT_GayMR16]